MIRVRFLANTDDSRPVKFPPPGPWWETGWNDNNASVVAYVNSLEEVVEYWPEAKEIDVLEEDTEIRFTDRFPKPDWWERTT